MPDKILSFTPSDVAGAISRSLDEAARYVATLPAMQISASDLSMHLRRTLDLVDVLAESQHVNMTASGAAGAPGADHGEGITKVPN